MKTNKYMVLLVVAVALVGLTGMASAKSSDNVVSKTKHEFEGTLDSNNKKEYEGSLVDTIETSSAPDVISLEGNVKKDDPKEKDLKLEGWLFKDDKKFEIEGTLHTDNGKEYEGTLTATDKKVEFNIKLEGNVFKEDKKETFIKLEGNLVKDDSNSKRKDTSKSGSNTKSSKKN